MNSCSFYIPAGGDNFLQIRGVKSKDNPKGKFVINCPCGWSKVFGDKKAIDSRGGKAYIP